MLSKHKISWKKKTATLLVRNRDIFFLGQTFYFFLRKMCLFLQVTRRRKPNPTLILTRRREPNPTLILSLTPITNRDPYPG